MGLYEMLFGNLPPQPRHPSSRGAMLGAGGYQDMPDMKAAIEDQRNDPNYAWRMKYAPVTRGALDTYGTSPIGGVPLGSMDAPGADMMLYAGGMSNPQGYSPESVAPYSPSFKQGWKPPYSRQAPYQRFDIPGEERYSGDNPTYGPSLPHQSNLPSEDWEHLPFAPGDPGWTPPPSPSGPHNRQGDPPRPGYDRPVFNTFGMTLNSVPQ